MAGMAALGSQPIYTMSYSGLPSVSGPSLISSLGSVPGSIESIGSSPSTAPTMFRTASNKPIIINTGSVTQMPQVQTSPTSKFRSVSPMRTVSAQLPVNVTSVATPAATSAPLVASVLAPTPSVPMAVAPVRPAVGTIALSMPMTTTKTKALAILQCQNARGRVSLTFPKDDQRIVSKELLRRHSGLFQELLNQADAQEMFNKAQEAGKEGRAAQLQSLAKIERQIAEHSEQQAETLKEALEGGGKKESEEAIETVKVNNPTIEFYKQQAAAHNARAEQYDKAIESAEKEEKEDKEEPLELFLDRSDELFDEILEWMCLMDVSRLGSQCALEMLKEKDEKDILRLLVEADFYEMRELLAQCQLVLTWKNYEKAKEKEEDWRAKWMESSEKD